MDLNEIKEIMESEGGKFIIVEQGKPVMVVVSFEDYKKRIKKKQNNLDIRKAAVIPKELREEELKIEDLPF